MSEVTMRVAKRRRKRSLCTKRHSPWRRRLASKSSISETGSDDQVLRNKPAAQESVSLATVRGSTINVLSDVSTSFSCL